MFLPTSSLQKCASSGLSVAASDPRTVSPDTQFRYGGIPWQIAGAVAEVASGKSWSELINEIYVEPCGLISFGYTSPWIPLRAISGNYPDWDGDLSLLPPTDNPHIGGGAYTTTGGYGKLLSMHLNDGNCDGQQVLSQEGVNLMQQNRSGEMYGHLSVMDWAGGQKRSLITAGQHRKLLTTQPLDVYETPVSTAQLRGSNLTTDLLPISLWKVPRV